MQPPRPHEDALVRLASIGEIAAEVAHELRNVLQVIATSAYVARQDPAQAAAHIVKIERNARLAHTIVDDLMSLARGEPAHAEPVLIADSVVAARSDLGESVVWCDAISPADLRVRAHPGLLARALHALYENAIGASAPRAPEITTRAWSDEERTLIEVQDDGPGVDPEIASRIFEALVTGRKGGTGLGLAMAKRIAVAHGGTIELVSASKGATFRIALPVLRCAGVFRAAQRALSLSLRAKPRAQRIRFTSLQAKSRARRMRFTSLPANLSGAPARALADSNNIRRRR